MILKISQKDRADRPEYGRGPGFDHYHHHSIVAENCPSKQRAEEVIDEEIEGAENSMKENTSQRAGTIASPKIIRYRLGSQ